MFSFVYVIYSSSYNLSWMCAPIAHRGIFFLFFFYKNWPSTPFKKNGSLKQPIYKQFLEKHIFVIIIASWYKTKIMHIHKYVCHSLATLSLLHDFITIYVLSMIWIWPKLYFEFRMDFLNFRLTYLLNGIRFFISGSIVIPRLLFINFINFNRPRQSIMHILIWWLYLELHATGHKITSSSPLQWMMSETMIYM